jgi:hypothetical protein
MAEREKEKKKGSPSRVSREQRPVAYPLQTLVGTVSDLVLIYVVHSFKALCTRMDALLDHKSTVI